MCSGNGDPLRWSPKTGRPRNLPSWMNLSIVSESVISISENLTSLRSVAAGPARIHPSGVQDVGECRLGHRRCWTAISPPSGAICSTMAPLTKGRGRAIWGLWLPSRNVRVPKPECTLPTRIAARRQIEHHPEYPPAMASRPRAMDLPPPAESAGDPSPACGASGASMSARVSACWQGHDSAAAHRLTRRRMTIAGQAADPTGPPGRES